jgi:hypothetical protein
MTRRRLVAVSEGVTYYVHLLTGCRWLPPHVVALTLGPSMILTRSEAPHAVTLAHELVHVAQFQRYRAFLFRYAWEWCRHGAGLANRWERAAYTEEVRLSEQLTYVITPRLERPDGS